jgi:hypothetical protein
LHRLLAHDIVRLLQLQLLALALLSTIASDMRTLLRRS